MHIKSQLSKIIADGLTTIGVEAENVTVTEASKPEFGDYQYNGAMALAKQLKTNPREIATKLATAIEDNEIFQEVSVAGPGFLNLRLSPSFIAKNLSKTLNERAGVSKRENPIKVVVDYSGPNMAKQMHVGHLRSTIIGDTIANLFEFLGDEVIRQNHIGDWGTQFGMLIAYFEENEKDSDSKLSDLELFYKEAKLRFDADEDFAKKSREYVVKLQSGDAKCHALWEKFINKSLEHCQDVYDALGVKLDRSSVKSESSYNEDLPQIIKDFQEKGIAQKSQGAECIFFEDSENPLIIQKSDGGYLYATTDLAAIKYRVQDLGAKRLCYVVDARQAEHFKQVFDAARRVGYADEDTKLEHIAFGMMLDKSGKPFKTRDGGTVKLKDLIDEAIKRARDIISRSNEYSQEELDKIAYSVGVGSLKYADLSINRLSNYIFDWDKMLSLDGNTALYMQYAYARINSILTKAGTINQNIELQLNDELERRLALKVLMLEETLYKAYSDAMPHIITNYLYELAGLFMKFYENNPILKSDVPQEIKESRLLLAKATANSIKVALNILGIDVLERI